jgi:hypothetical protein
MPSGKFEEGSKPQSTNRTTREEMIKPSEKTEVRLDERVTIITRPSEPKYFHRPECRRVKTHIITTDIKEITKREALRDGYSPIRGALKRIKARSINGTTRTEVTKPSEKSEERLTEKVTVLETRLGQEPKYFHKPDCRRVKTFLDQSSIKEISKKDAIKEGYSPCPWCMEGK